MRNGSKRADHRFAAELFEIERAGRFVRTVVIEPPEVAQGPEEVARGPEEEEPAGEPPEPPKIRGRTGRRLVLRRRL
jgi:hypothetical protein